MHCRVGQEVLVDFLDGDIDRPVVIGSLYNGAGQNDAQHDQFLRGSGAATGNAPAWFPWSGQEMNMDNKFENRRRQPYIYREAYDGTLHQFEEDYALMAQTMAEHEGDPYQRSLGLKIIASHRWFSFQLKYTAGEDLAQLATELTKVVEACECYVDELDKVPDDLYFTPYPLDDLIDEYVDFVNLLSAAILLHREELVPRVYGLIAGTDYDGDDAVIEELLKFFLPARPEIDQWIWDQPYRLLLEAIDEQDPIARAAYMKNYVKRWYPSMKGRAHFWGKHEHVNDSFSAFNGYWAMCAGAFSYLYGIDDSCYRKETVYPRDLVDYARSMPRSPVASEGGGEVLRVVGGDRCQRTGTWFTPADEESERRFSLCELMPSVNASDDGAAIWQWRGD